jgi:hypothetical protein
MCLVLARKRKGNIDIYNHDQIQIKSVHFILLEKY